ATNCGCEPGLAGGTPQWFCVCTVTDETGQHWLGVAANYQTFPGTPGSGGCPQNMYNQNGSDCCACMITTCPEGSTLNRATCECATPTPTPTPAPSDGGGGGGGGSGGGGGGYTCIPYDWVLYNYIHGTWVEVARWYAGCF